MRVTIVCVGKIKEDFYKKAIEEYSKRLSRYVKLEIIEVVDEMTPDKINDNERLNILLKEADRILSKIKDSDTVITLEIEGKKYSSEDFAGWIQNQGVIGNSSLCFVIGGSLGLHPNVIKRSNMHLSFSDMTFPHQLMRVVLLEQIYRAQRIINGEPYHK